MTWNPTGAGLGEKDYSAICEPGYDFKLERLKRTLAMVSGPLACSIGDKI
jgi:hypothetical protein